MAHSKPSEETFLRWLEVRNNTGKDTARQPANGRGGKWMIFFEHLQSLDAAWEIVARATIDGLLGWRAGVRTIVPGDNTSYEGGWPICVNTYDYDDLQDVVRVCRRLEELEGFALLGFYYKADDKKKWTKDGDKYICSYIKSEVNSVIYWQGDGGERRPLEIQD